MKDDAKHRLWRMMEPSDQMSRGQAFCEAVIYGLAIVSAVCVAFATVPGLAPASVYLANALILLASTVFTVEFILRLWLAPQSEVNPAAAYFRARWRYVFSVIGMIDLASALPIVLVALFTWTISETGLLALFALCKAVRYVDGLRLLAKVVRRERASLFSVLLILMMLTMISSGLMYTVEHAAQPKVFKSIPHTLWWAIVTVATVGYGDMTPVTDIGRIFGGLIMILGVAMFAMPAGILASGFADEMHQRKFLVTWQTVAQVPLFSTLSASQIAEITSILKPQVVPAHRVIVHHGEPADAMFFIMSGEVEVEIAPHPVRLGQGQFFGEIALLKDTTRTATVATLKDSDLLSLDAHDFRALIDKYPALREHVVRLADDRLEELEGISHS